MNPRKLLEAVSIAERLKDATAIAIRETDVMKA